MVKPSQQSIKALGAKIKQCRICRDDPMGKQLPHEPRPVLVMSQKAKIAICGQAPGNRVHQSGKPFTDQSGKRLRDWMGVDEDIFYNPSLIAIIPMGFCFPGNDTKGGDLPPRKECAATWHESVFKLMPQLELLLLIGRHAQKYHLKNSVRDSLSETVFNWNEYFECDDRGKKYIPLPHPSWRNNAWIKKNTWFDNELLPFLKNQIHSRIA